MKQPLNLLVISPNSPFESICGVERHIRNLLKHCPSEDRLRTTIMVPTYGHGRSERRGNLTIVFSKNLAFSRRSAKAQKEITAKAARFSQEVSRLIDERTVDVVCAENFHLGLPAAHNLLLNMVAGIRSVPIVLRLHSFAATDLQTDRRARLCGLNLHAIHNMAVWTQCHLYYAVS